MKVMDDPTLRAAALRLIDDIMDSVQRQRERSAAYQVQKEMPDLFRKAFAQRRHNERESGNVS